MQTLPRDLVLILINFLPAALARCLRASRKLWNLYKDDGYLWRALVLAWYPVKLPKPAVVNAMIERWPCLDDVLPEELQRDTVWSNGVNFHITPQRLWFKDKMTVLQGPLWNICTTPDGAVVGFVDTRMILRCWTLDDGLCVHTRRFIEDFAFVSEQEYFAIRELEFARFNLLSNTTVATWDNVYGQTRVGTSQGRLYSFDPGLAAWTPLGVLVFTKDTGKRAIVVLSTSIVWNQGTYVVLLDPATGDEVRKIQDPAFGLDAPGDLHFFIQGSTTTRVYTAQGEMIKTIVGDLMRRPVLRDGFIYYTTLDHVWMRIRL